VGASGAEVSGFDRGAERHVRLELKKISAKDTKPRGLRTEK